MISGNNGICRTPPSSDIIHPQLNDTKKKKRKRDGQQGHSKHTRELFTADQIDETIVHKLSDQDIRRRNLIELPQTRLALQQISLPKRRYRVSEHRVQLYQTSDGKIVSEILPTAIRKTGLFSSDMIALVGYFKGRCHMSYSTLRALFLDIAAKNRRSLVRRVAANFAKDLQKLERSPQPRSKSISTQNG